MIHLSLQGVKLDRTSAIPLSRQLYEKLRDAIIDGQLSAAGRLPSTREMAGLLRVSRTTVVDAYSDLCAEGYIEGKAGSGTYVAGYLPERMPIQRHIRAGQRQSKVQPIEVSHRGQDLLKATGRIAARSDGDPVRPFMAGIPSLDDFPYHLWSRMLRRQLNRLPRADFSYGDPAGFLPLRECIAEYLRAARAVRLETDQVIIVNGSQESFSLIAHCLADPEDSVVIEDPAYRGALMAYQVQGLGVVPVPLDDEGLAITSIPAKVGHLKLIHVSPSHQYPTGTVMSLSRRVALLAYAERNRCWIVEDDYDSDFRFSGQPISSLQGIDNADCVIYTGTFSKVLYPSMRIGYIVVPKRLVETFRAAKQAMNRGTNTLDQATLNDFIRAGHFHRHLRKMRVQYQNRQSALLRAVRTKLDDVMRVNDSDSGLHVVGWLKEGHTETGITEAAARAGITLIPVNSFCLKHRIPGGVMLGYAPFTEKEITRSINKLAGQITGR